ncbi:hypothetical protein GCM10011491_30580 [Brucella endophytica]|uniref:Uncharacterized protein n=1 Tax=Brucella endophytica TaxID=1963359 RepID=A0A916WIA9_9HYPH|nr:hypothetical protein GCM10011491_30580 [Brucella endophytica]
MDKSEVLFERFRHMAAIAAWLPSSEPINWEMRWDDSSIPADNIIRPMRVPVEHCVWAR